MTTRNKNKKLPSWTSEFTILQMDLLDKGSIADCFRAKSVDVIIHLAALNEVESIKDPINALDVNTKGTFFLLDLASINNVSKFVYFSTFHVYGCVSSPLITEETPTRPTHPYALTHRAAEDFVNFFNRYHSMKTLVLRLSNSFGYPMDKEVDRWTLVFNDLCRQAVLSNRILLTSSGKQHRDFIALHDVVRAVYHLLFVKPDLWGDGIYNLGGSCSMSILDVAERVSEVYKKKYNRELKEMKTGTDSNKSTTFKPVKFSIDKIRETGFSLKNNMNYEIEKCMSLCEEFSN